MVDLRPARDAGRPAPAASPGPVLRVYVADGCAGCCRARVLVARLLRRCPDADVALVDLGRTPPDQPLPAGLVGTPTYTVDGRVHWLGNPAAEELFALVGRRRATP